MQSARRVALFTGAAFALALVVGMAAGGLSGALDVALYAAPFLAIATLLLSAGSSARPVVLSA